MTCTITDDEEGTECGEEVVRLVGGDGGALPDPTLFNM